MKINLYDKKTKITLCLVALVAQLLMPQAILADIPDPGTIGGDEWVLHMYQQSPTTFPVAMPGESTCGWFGSIMYRQSILRSGRAITNYIEIKHWSSKEPLPDSLTWDGRGDDGKAALAGNWLISLSYHTFTDGICDTSTQKTYNNQLDIHPSSQASYQYTAEPQVIQTLREGQGGSIRYNGPHHGALNIGEGNPYLSLQDQAGQEVYRFYYIKQSEAGRVTDVFDLEQPLNWDGKDANGAALPAGRYTLSVSLSMPLPLDVASVSVTGSSQIIIYPLNWDTNQQYPPTETPTDPEPTPAPTPTATPTPTPTPSPTPTPTPIDPSSKLHPVLLIHGLNSYPTMWSEPQSDYFSLLENAGYPADYVAAYHYTGIGVGKNHYNNQGDIAQMATGMHAAVESLSQLSKSHGGDGQVDIVAHSMGGLIARQYIKDYPSTNHINKLIAIATPFQGSWLMEKDERLGIFQDPVNTIFSILYKRFGLFADPTQVAERQMTPGSNLLQTLNHMPTSKVIKYYNLSGAIDIVFRQQLFGTYLYSSDYPIGDGVVDENSSSTVSRNQSSTNFRYQTEQRYIIERAIMGQALTYSYIHITGNIFRWPNYHTNLPKAGIVKANVIKDLAK